MQVAGAMQLGVKMQVGEVPRGGGVVLRTRPDLYFHLPGAIKVVSNIFHVYYFISGLEIMKIDEHICSNGLKLRTKTTQHGI